MPPAGATTESRLLSRIEGGLLTPAAVESFCQTSKDLATTLAAIVAAEDKQRSKRSAAAAREDAEKKRRQARDIAASMTKDEVVQINLRLDKSVSSPSLTSSLVLE